MLGLADALCAFGFALGPYCSVGYWCEVRASKLAERAWCDFLIYERSVTGEPTCSYNTILTLHQSLPTSQHRFYPSQDSCLCVKSLMEALGVNSYLTHDSYGEPGM